MFFPNVFIYTGNDYNIGSIGIGFAIPINYARRFLDEVATHGQVRRPWTGILELQNLTSRLADYSDPKIDVISMEVISPKYTIVKSILLATNKKPRIKNRAPSDATKEDILP